MMGMPSMSLSETFCCAVLLLLHWSTPTQLQQFASNVLTCPATLLVEESASPPSGWNAVSATAKRGFERISIYQRSPEGEEFDLAPDEQKQTTTNTSQVWNLPTDRSMPIFLRCRYRNSAVVLETKISLALHKCTLDYVHNARGMISGASEVQCR
jgi:hypothetical protein